MSYLNEVINSNLIKLDLEGKNKKEVLEELTDLLVFEQKVISRAEYIKQLYEREVITSTYCGSEIAIPHATSSTVKIPTVCFGRSKEGLFWDDNSEWVRFIFMFAIPENNNGEEHISILSEIARRSIAPEIRALWLNATTKEQILDSLRE